jgi:hypothetical protein
MIQFLIPARRNNAILDSSRRKLCSFEFQQAEMMQFWHTVGENNVTVDANRIYFVDEQS